MKKNNSKWITVMCSVIVVALLVYLFHDVFKSNFKAYETETAQEVVEQETLGTQAFVVRDETYLDFAVTGTVVPLVSDGMRVASGDSVAEICQSDEDAADFSKLIKCRETLERYQQLSTQTELNSIDMKKLNNEINEKYKNLLNIIESGNFTKLDESKTEVENKLASKQIISDGAIDFNGKISELQSQISSLEAKNSRSEKVSAPASGYFISNIDGFENTISYNAVKNLTVSQVENALNAEPKQPSGKVGKMVTSYMWYICAVIDSKTASRIDNREIININIPYYGIENVEVKIEKITKSDDDRAVVVFSCDMMNETYANMRFIDIEIVISEFRGYKIDSSAIRQAEDADGRKTDVVYIIRGNIMNIRRIKILYDTGEYAIVQGEQDDSSKYKPIKMYDEVIINGRNLEDGKSISV